MLSVQQLARYGSVVLVDRCGNDDDVFYWIRHTDLGNPRHKAKNIQVQWTII